MPRRTHSQHWITLTLKPATLILTALMLTLAGCGFQPRGQVSGVQGVPSPLHVSGINRFSALGRELSKQLRTAGVAESADGSATVLHISRWNTDARVLSVDSRNKAVEYELEETARFELRTPNQQVVPESQTVRVLRIQFRPSDAVLGSSREAELLREDMRRELVQRMLQRIAAQR